MIEENMRNVALYLTGSFLIALSAALLVLPEFATTHAQQSAPAAQEADSVPSFHAQPPSGELPPTMAPSLFNETVVFNAYAAAARVKKVLYQEPCYCHCDRSVGHGSLLDCFVGRHGAGCGTCIKEVFYSYEQTRAGKTPSQIREGIIRGDWQKVDLAKYETGTLPSAK
jgi:hypothetical protein